MDETIPQAGWWSRNWKWFVPVGCLTLLMTCGCCIGGSMYFAFNVVKSSHVYKDALAKAVADPDVQKALGTPVEAGWMVEYQANASNDHLNIVARIPLEGPKASGSLHVLATQKGSEIRYQRLDVVVGNDVIHLAGTTVPGAEADEVEAEESEDEAAANEEVTVEARTDRPGPAYRDNPAAPTDDASNCASDCSLDPKCKAYTFVKPQKGKPGRCLLKEAAAPKATSDCCVSGVKK